MDTLNRWSTDYPWDTIKGLVVDVGGGVGKRNNLGLLLSADDISLGGMCLDLASLYPHLKFVVEDRAPVLQRGQEIWSKEFPGYLQNNQVQFVPHDFFTEQPVKGADVYSLRYIL